MIHENDTWKKNNKSKKKNVSVMTSCMFVLVLYIVQT